MNTPPPEQPDDFARYLTVLAGCRAFVAASLGKPMVMLSQAEYAALVHDAESDALAKEEKSTYDESRLDHHARPACWPSTWTSPPAASAPGISRMRISDPPHHGQRADRQAPLPGPADGR